MKTIYFYFFILILSCGLYAQTLPEPLLLSKNLLVHSAGLPEEFLLFSPDSAVQIVFNPARANNFRSNFIYVNYLSDYVDYQTAYLKSYPDYITLEGLLPAPAKANDYNFPSLINETYSYTKNPTFSFVSLIKDNNAGWLFSFTNGINIDMLNQNQIINELENTRTSDNFDKEVSDFERKTDEIRTALKVSRIWSGHLNFSLGIWGIVDNYNRNLKEVSDHVSKYVYTNYSSIDFYQNSYNHKVKSNVERYSVGIEFSANNENIDYIGSVSWQKNKSPQDLEYFSNRFQYDSTYFTDSLRWQLYESIEKSQVNGTLESHPYLLSLRNYFQHKINLITPDDNIFFALNGFYSAGDDKYRFKFNTIMNSSLNENLLSADTANGNFETIIHNKSWGMDLSAGYVLKKSFSDLYLLSGLKLSGFYKKLMYVIPNLGSSSVLFMPAEDKSGLAALTLPLYIYYSILKSVSIYGGLNYNYYYQWDHINFESLRLSSSSYYLNYSISELVKSTSTSWHSQKTIYLGCEFRHDSGLKLQFFFNRDFSLISGWNVSVGYHF